VPKPGIEIVEKEKPADEPQLAPAQARQQTAKRRLQLCQIGAAALFVDQEQGAEDRKKRRDADNHRIGMQCPRRRQMLDEDAAEQGARDRRHVEP
jgi:hypothetical protein